MDETFADCILAAKAELQCARSLLQSEIAGYPTPIAGCDAQFNHLLAERSRVQEALSRLDAMVFVPTTRSPTLCAGVESR